MVGRLTFLCCLTLVFLACAELDKPAPDKPSKPSDPPPAKEVITVELSKDDGPLTRKAAGFVRGISISEPKDELLRPLKPTMFRQPVNDTPVKYGALEVSNRAVSLGATKLHAVLSGSVKYDGEFPGEKGKWDKWLSGVELVVRQAIASRRPVVWEIWDEPDAKASWKGNRDQYHALWIRTFRKIRSVDPNAVIAGPSIEKWDGGWIDGFRKVAKDYDAQPDIICWHEKDIRPDIAGHINGMDNSEWQDGFKALQGRVVFQAINEKLRNHPAIAVFFIAAIERSKASAGARQGVGESGTQLASLLTADHKPRAAWWVYKAYAEFDGRLAHVSKTDTLDGVAAWNAEKKTASVILGRARKSMGTTQPAAPKLLGPVEVKLTGVPGNNARVIAYRLPTSDGQAVPKLMESMNVEMPVNGKELKVLLPMFDDGDAYILNVSGVKAESKVK